VPSWSTRSVGRAGERHDTARAGGLAVRGSVGRADGPGADRTTGQGSGVLPSPPSKGGACSAAGPASTPRPASEGPRGAGPPPRALPDQHSSLLTQTGPRAPGRASFSLSQLVAARCRVVAIRAVDCRRRANLARFGLSEREALSQRTRPCPAPRSGRPRSSAPKAASVHWRTSEPGWPSAARQEPGRGPPARRPRPRRALGRVN
jgi:hypothetical protein